MAHGNRDPKPGDLIEIRRGIYQHWALYVGDGYVIHVTGVDEGAPSPSSPSVGSAVFTSEAKVKKQLLKEVVGNNKWRVNNKYDRLCTPLPVEKIIQRAERCVDREVSYNLLFKNCEHFVTLVRYGKAVCLQVIIGIIRVAALCAILLL